MRKLFIEILIFIALFFSLWFALGRIDWMSLFKIEQLTKSTEEKLGDTFWEFFSKTETEIKSTSVNKSLDSLVSHICKENNIDRSTIKLHLLRKQDINAFTLPNRHIVVFSGLIESSENEAELCGVLGHEMAHMEKNHVMKKLLKEVGLSVLVSMTSGKGSPEAARQLAKLLSSSAYDRKLESEADIASVDYMIKADIDPAPFADILYRLGDEEKNIPNQVYWISTHPESKERAENIVQYIKGKKIIKKSVLSAGEWERMKEKLSEKED